VIFFRIVVSIGMEIRRSTLRVHAITVHHFSLKNQEILQRSVCRNI